MNLLKCSAIIKANKKPHRCLMGFHASDLGVSLTGSAYPQRYAMPINATQNKKGKRVASLCF